MSSMYTTHSGHRKNYDDVFLGLLLATNRSAVSLPPELDAATLPEVRLDREQDHTRTLQSGRYEFTISPILTHAPSPDLPHHSRGKML